MIKYAMVIKFKAITSVSGVVGLNLSISKSILTCDQLIKNSGNSISVLNFH